MILILIITAVLILFFEKDEKREWSRDLMNRDIDDIYN